MKVLGLALAAALLAGGCSQAIAPERQLDVRVTPAEIKPGVKVLVTVKPIKDVTLEWVKGLVDLPGFGKSPTVPLKYDQKNDAWTFRSMIPAFVSVPSGEYEVRAWGENSLGEKYGGQAIISVK